MTGRITIDLFTTLDGVAQAPRGLLAEQLEVLERFVASVWASDAPPLELVVVDNGSTDGSREWLAGRLGS